MLKLPPIKQIKITNYLTYKTKSKNTGAFVYKMANKQGQIVGEMIAYPETIYDINRQFSPHADSYKSFFIKSLMAFNRNKNVGTTFINIAKKESLRNFCLGNLHLISSSRFDKINPPHIFYRKMGFKFNKYSKLTEKYIDDCIKNHKQVEQGHCPMDIPMYIIKNIDENTESKHFYLFRQFPYLSDIL